MSQVDKSLSTLRGYASDSDINVDRRWLCAPRDYISLIDEATVAFLAERDAR